jgi:hypothetical protein
VTHSVLVTLRAASEVLINAAANLEAAPQELAAFLVYHLILLQRDRYLQQPRHDSNEHHYNLLSRRMGVIKNQSLGSQF